MFVAMGGSGMLAVRRGSMFSAAMLGMFTVAVFGVDGVFGMGGVFLRVLGVGTLVMRVLVVNV